MRLSELSLSTVGFGQVQVERGTLPALVCGVRSSFYPQTVLCGSRAAKASGCSSPALQLGFSRQGYEPLLTQPAFFQYPNVLLVRLV